MPDVGIFDFGPDPSSEVLKQLGLGLAGAIQKSGQEDALSSLLSGVSGQQNQEDVLKQILSTRGLPLEQRLGLFDAISSVRKQAEQQQAANELAKQFGLPKGLTPDQIQKQIMATAKQAEAGTKRQQEQRDSEILSRYQRGEELTPEELSQLSPTSLRSLINAEQSKFEPEEEKLEAQRVSKLADEISRANRVAETEELRLKQQERLVEKGNLSSPVVVKFLDSIGMPLSVLGNPDNEEYSKVEAEFVRDVSNIFPGQIRVYEIEAYMKTIPSLLNSDEGKKAIIKQRRLMNEASKIRYKAYKDILKENNGRKPRNLDILIEERTSDKINELGLESRELMRNAIDKYSVPVKMYDKQGQSYDIPPNRIEQAINKGLFFK
jgi:hypothetical protein